MRASFPAIVCAALTLACGAADEPDVDRLGECPSVSGERDAFVDCVIEFSPAEETNYNHDLLPDVVLGPPAGSFDVVSLGCGGSITLYLDEPAITDGPGADFIVFENPFEGFAEPAEVEVSEDGETWHLFECDPVSLEGCAGATPTEALPSSELEPTNPDEAGGDAFDLAEVGLSEARYVRLTDVSREHWTAQDADYCDPGQQGKGGHDLDAIAVVRHP